MFQKPTPLTTGLIIACIICYLPELIGFNVNGWLAVSPYSPYYAPWQLVTAMFAHGSIDHLAMNMVSLWWLGTMLEKMQGTVRFAISESDNSLNKYSFVINNASGFDEAYAAWTK